MRFHSPGAQKRFVDRMRRGCRSDDDHVLGFCHAIQQNKQSIDDRARPFTRAASFADAVEPVDEEDSGSGSFGLCKCS